MSKKEKVEGTETSQVNEKEVRLVEIKERVTAIEQEVSKEGADVKSLMAEFKELLAEAQELSKKVSVKKKGTGTTPRVGKLGILKNMKVSFNPRNTMIDLIGVITGLAIDNRNGFYILSIQHDTGMKFNKKIDGVTLVEPTEEQTAYHEELIAEQEALVAKVKEAKALEAEAAKEAEGQPEGTDVNNEEPEGDA